MTTNQWQKVRAGQYSRRIGERERIDITNLYDGFLCKNYWQGRRVLEGEKTWMRDVESVELGQWPTLRDAKAALS